MYREFILSSLAKDLFIGVAFWMIWIPVIYFGARFNKEEARGCALLVLFMIFGGISLLNIVINAKYYADYFQYLKAGDAYVRETVCHVKKAHAPTLAAIVVGTQYLQCENGLLLRLRYRRDYQRIHPKTGRIFHIRYLPKSGLIVEMHPIRDA